MAKYYKHPKFGITYADKPYLTPPCRLCWPYLTKPKDPPPPVPGQQPGLPSYEVTLLFPKDSAAHQNWIRAVGVVFADMLKTFNQGRSVEIAKILAVKDGDDPKWDKEKYPYYKGQQLLVARSTKLPTFVTATKEPADPAIFIGGCLVCAVLTPKICASGATYGLEVVQMWKDDGVRFAGSTKRAVDHIAMLTVPEDLEVDAGASYDEQAEEPEAEEAVPQKKKKVSLKKAEVDDETVEEAADEAIGTVKAQAKRGKAGIASLL